MGDNLEQETEMKGSHVDDYWTIDLDIKCHAGLKKATPEAPTTTPVHQMKRIASCDSPLPLLVLALLTTPLPQQKLCY